MLGPFGRRSTIKKGLTHEAAAYRRLWKAAISYRSVGKPSSECNYCAPPRVQKGQLQEIASSFCLCCPTAIDRTSTSSLSW